MLEVALGMVGLRGATAPEGPPPILTALV
jgi:hypothetical protein